LRHQVDERRRKEIVRTVRVAIAAAEDARTRVIEGRSRRVEERIEREDRAARVVPRRRRV
jgi:hypothetical protein